MMQCNIKEPGAAQRLGFEALAARGLTIPLDAAGRARWQDQFNDIPGVQYMGCSLDLSHESVVRVHLPEIRPHHQGGLGTEAVNGAVLAGLCDYVIIGHSERRQYFGESGEFIDRKIKAALAAGLKPILCIGERLEENEAGRTEDVLAAQLAASSQDEYYRGGMVVAYEPVWAIGTGRSATGEQANATIGFIRRGISKRHGNDIADKVRILYGGSVKPDNVKGLMALPDVDGALVGGASLKADSFLKLVHFEKQ